MDDDHLAFGYFVHSFLQLVEWDIETPINTPFLPLLLGSDIQHQWSLRRREPLGQGCSGNAKGTPEQIGVSIESLHSTFEVASYVIEPDPSQSYRRLFLLPWIDDNNDRPFSIEEGPTPGRITSAKSNVETVGQMGAGEIRGIACIQELSPLTLEINHLIEG